MALPKQVEQQMKEIKEMEREAAQPTERVEDTQPAAPEPSNEPESESAPPPETEAKAEPAPQPAVDWERRYYTLEGKYSAEVPRLHSQVKELTQQLQDLAQKVSSKPADTVEADSQLVSQAEVDAYGADLIDVQRRIAKEVMREYVNPLKAELAQRDSRIAQLEASVQKTGGEVTTMSFEQQLSRAIPDFNQINDDQKWIAWLDETDPYTQEPRRSYAEYVYNRGDVDKLKKIVEFFKATTGQVEQVQQQKQRQSELERQVAPSRNASASSVPQGERAFTSAEMDRLWNKVRELYVKGQNDEAAKLENDLTQAIRDGRVR